MSVKVARVLHAGYIFECEGVRVLFDPLFENPFSRNCFAFPPIRFDTKKIQEQKFDAVFISHYHDDHCSFESLNLLSLETPLYIYCWHEELIDWLKEFGFKNVYQLHLNETTSVGPFEIITRQALDADVDSIFHIRAEELNVLNVVDSWIGEETMQKLASLAGWDLVLWPFQTMREIEVLSPLRAPPAQRNIPHEWIAHLQTLSPRFLVPSSCQFKFEDWSWYNQFFFPISYAGFTEQVSAVLPQTKIIRLDPGDVFVLDQKSFEKQSELEWVEKIKSESDDYDYVESVTPTATAEIAQRLPGLNAAEKMRITDYLTLDILHRYSILPQSEELFFQKTVSWKLRVFDEKGLVTDYDYQLQGQEMRLVDQPLGDRVWTTEVPAYTLYRAIEEGESLTAMYIRINPQLMSESLESELAMADVMEDPLVRSLFNGIFGSYQLAQFERLRPLNS